MSKKVTLPSLPPTASVLPSGLNASSRTWVRRRARPQSRPDCGGAPRAGCSGWQVSRRGDAFACEQKPAVQKRLDERLGTEPLCDRRCRLASRRPSAPRRRRSPRPRQGARAPRRAGCVGVCSAPLAARPRANAVRLSSRKSRSSRFSPPAAVIVGPLEGGCKAGAAEALRVAPIAFHPFAAWVRRRCTRRPCASSSTHETSLSHRSSRASCTSSTDRRRRRGADARRGSRSHARALVVVGVELLTSERRRVGTSPSRPRRA